MHRLALFALLPAVLLASCGDAPTPSEETKGKIRTQEDLARHVFAALKAGDFAAQGDVLPAASDIEWTLEKVAESAPKEAKRSREGMAKSGGALKIAERSVIRSEDEFAKALELSRKVFDWSTATFRGVDKDQTRTRERFGYKSADIYFGVAASADTYDFVLRKCVETPRGWLVAGGVVFRPPGAPDPLDAKAKLLQANLHNLGQALQLYYLVHRTMPESLEVLTQPDSHSGEPFVDRIPKDPWGNALIYAKQSEKNYQILSAGPDGKAGTDDDVVWPKAPAGGDAEENAGD